MNGGIIGCFEMENIKNIEKERSYILIEFKDLDSAIFDARFEHIVPGQMLAVASYLEFEGKNQLAMQKAAQMQAELMKQQREQIIVPTPQVKL